MTVSRSADAFSSLSAAQLIEGYASGLFSPVEVMQGALERAHAFQASLNAFVLLDDEKALAMARASEARWHRQSPLGLLDGVPVAVKDTSAVKGWPTRYGSLSGRDAPDAKEDAPLVQRMREHGAAFIGKTAVPEFAWKGIADSAAHGVTRNPWNSSLTSGGSSGGSAVAVALGVVPIATGADGGGSLRIPASFCGIYGLKPTAGVIPNYPTPLGTMAVVGGLTRTVDDMHRFLRVVTEPDSRDPFAVIGYPDRLSRSMTDSLEGVRVGVCSSFGGIEPTADIAGILKRAAQCLVDQGAIVEWTTFDADDMREAFVVLWRLGFAEILNRLSAGDRAAVEPALKEVADQAASMSANDVQLAQRLCRVLCTRLATFFDQYDVMLTPTLPIAAFEAGKLVPDASRYAAWWDWTPYTWPLNLSRNPAASCPAGFTDSGLPVGVQCVGKWFDEMTVLRVSQALETQLSLSVALSKKALPGCV